MDGRKVFVLKFKESLGMGWRVFVFYVKHVFKGSVMKCLLSLVGFSILSMFFMGSYGYGEESYVNMGDEESYWDLEKGKDINIEEVKTLTGTDFHLAMLSPDAKHIFMQKRGAKGAYLMDVLSGDIFQMPIERSGYGRFVSWVDSFHLLFESFDLGSKLEKGNYLFDLRWIGLSEEEILKRLGTKLQDSDFISFQVYEKDDNIYIGKGEDCVHMISDLKLDDGYFRALLSSDNRFVAFSGLHSGVYLYDIFAGEIVQHFRDAYEPYFSGDGKKLVINLAKDNGYQYSEGDIYIVDLEKREISKLSNPEGEIRVYGSLDYDGHQVSYSVVGKGIVLSSIVD